MILKVRVGDVNKICHLLCVYDLYMLQSHYWEGANLILVFFWYSYNRVEIIGRVSGVVKRKFDGLGISGWVGGNEGGLGVGSKE